MPKSGAWPVMPNTVVFRYLSCPARSMNVITFDDFSQIFTQSKWPWSGLFTTLPTPSNPRISLPTELVRPLSISCLCRNRRCRAWPRPLSSSPCVRTPNKVDLPASTLPTTATLKERSSWHWNHCCSTSKARVLPYLHKVRRIDMLAYE